MKKKKKKKEIQCVCVIIVIRRSFRNNIGIGLKSETAGDETRWNEMKRDEIKWDGFRGGRKTT